tara:strand:+ start:572 stop:985 length:414 start_codon:yes stop_codon:yes gene_type:complete
MSFFLNPPPSCKIYEGRTCIPSLRTFIFQLPDIIEDGTIHGSTNKWKQNLLKDFEKIEKQNHLAYGRGQMGIEISSDGRVVDYTWSFGQKTTRRLQKWCKQTLSKGSTFVAVTIHSPDWVIKDDCFKQSFDESVEEE